MRLVEDLGEQGDDVVVAPELREVLEREVDGTADGAGAAQVTELVELSLATGHTLTIRRRADAPLPRG